MALPKLEIKSEKDAYTLRQMQVLLDGREIPGLQSLTLYLEPNEVNQIVVHIAVSEVAIDPQTYVLMQAYVREEKEN